MLKKWIVAFSLWFTALSCHATYIDLYLSGGAEYSKLSNDTTVVITNSLTSNYHTNRRTVYGPILGAGIGYTVQNDIFNRPVNLALAVNAYYTNFGHIRGLNQTGGFFGGPSNYHFKAQSYALMFEPRIIYVYYDWQPFVFGGVGSARNRLYNYSETYSPVPQIFRNRDISAFAYEFGAGLQHFLFNNDSNHVGYYFALEYHYLNFGSGRLGKSLAQTSRDALQISKLDAQALMLSFRATVF